MANDFNTNYQSVYTDPDQKDANGWASIPLIGGQIGQQLANKDAAQIHALQASNAGKLQGPQFTGDYQLAGLYNPETYQDPTQPAAALADVGPEGRASQLDALNQLRDRSDQSIGSQQALDRYNAMQGAAQFANSREGAILQDAQRTGRAGSAAQMLLRGQAAQAGANQAQAGGLQAAQAAALARLQASSAQGNMASQLRGQDMTTAFQNQDAINNFAQHNADALNQIRQLNTTTRNQAQLGNLGAVQSVLNARVNRGDANAMNTFNSNNTILGNINGALGGQATGATQGVKDVAAQQQAGWDQIKDLAKGIGGAAA